MNALPPASFVSSERVAQLAMDLVRLDTQNPPGNEAVVVPTLLELLNSLGCTTEVFEPTLGRPSVLATYRGSAVPTATLLINGHIDVVPIVAADWTAPPFEPVVRDGRLYGRGSADMKGGIAAAIEGLRACIDADIDLGCDISFHLVADEETGGAHGTQALLEAGLIKADACIVPEPTELRVSIAERGSFQAKVEVFGESGHGGDPRRWRSAVADAARMITALHVADFEEPPHPLLGTPTCNVSMVRGGIATNVIAPHCEFDLDRRTLPGQTAPEVMASIVAKIEAACPDADYRIHPTFFCEASELSETHPFAQVVRAAAPESEQEFVGLFLGTDGRFLRNQLGIPTVIFGPGSIRQAHTADEWVDVDQLHQAALAFARIFERFADSFTNSINIKDENG